MKITDVRKDAADDKTGEVESGNKRTIQTGKYVHPKVTISIEYEDGTNVKDLYTEAEDFVRRVEQKDQLGLFDKKEESKVA